MCRSAGCEPVASRVAIASARSSSSSSGTQSETSPMRSASTPSTRLAEQQVVLRLRHPAEQRPDDRGMVAGRDAELRVPVDDACVAVSQSRRRRGARRRALPRSRGPSSPTRSAWGSRSRCRRGRAPRGRRVAGSRGRSRSRAPGRGRRRRRTPRRRRARAPHASRRRRRSCARPCQLAVHRAADGIQLPGGAERQPQDVRRGPVELEARIGVVCVVHRADSSAVKVLRDGRRRGLARGSGLDDHAQSARRAERAERCDASWDPGRIA